MKFQLIDDAGPYAWVRYRPGQPISPNNPNEEKGMHSTNSTDSQTQKTRETRDSDCDIILLLGISVVVFPLTDTN